MAGGLKRARGSPAPSDHNPVMSQASLIVDMPLSRTRSLLANINSSATVSDNNSYQSHFSDTQHLPPLKSKLIGGPGTLFNGVTSSTGHSNGDNCDSMSINGSIVSNGSVTSIAGGANTTSLTNG